jgi:ribosomal protein L22
MLPTLYNVARHAVQKNLNPVCLYIHGVIVGKKRRFRGIRFHAKGRGGRE